MKKNTVRVLSKLSLFVSGFTALLCQGQSTLNITFDGLPGQPPESESFVEYYSEKGMWFRPINSSGFVRNGGGRIIEYPFNGTAYVQGGLQSDFGFGLDDNSVFGVAAMDLARYSFSIPELNLTFVGYRFDGSTITTNFSATLLNDNTFHTVHLGSEWSSGLTRVEIPSNPWSMDNLVVIIPEPSLLALFFIGAVTVLAFRKRRSRG